MHAISRVFTTVSEFYKDLNPATLSGAIDVIVVERPDGTLHCSPFHVRFGKMHLLRPQEKNVELFINSKPVPFAMKVGEAGEAFFVVESNVRNV
jgi:phosphatidate phosphatase LPIN